MAGNIKGIIVEVGGDTSGLQKALKKVNSSTSSLSKELRGINSLLKLDPKNTELVSQKQKVLKQNIQETSKKLEELKKAQEMADEKIAKGGKISEESYRNLQREIINTENKLKQMKLEASKWTRAGRSIEEFGNKVSNVSSKISKMGTTLTTRLTLPIAGIAVGLVNAAKEFETAFTGVEKTVDGTATQMANLKQGIKDLSEELPSSTTEIAAVAEAAGQLGIQTDNVLDFTKTMINMGNATNLSADEAATTLARFANVTKMSQSDFSKLGSVIVALGNNFATTEAEIADMGMNLASAGTQVGMSQSEIMALATALSSVGLEAQAGGTAFSKVMVNMQLAVEKGGKDLKNFASVAGMTTTQFKKAFKEDATSAIMQFVDGLSKSGERGKSAIRILDDMGITETRLRDALLRSANASKVMSKAIDLGNEAWEENTALTNEASKRYQTLDSRLKMTQNKIKNLATNTGDKLTPTFNKLLDKVDKLIDKFNGLNEEETKNVIKTAAIAAAIGPAIKILGTFGSGIGKTITGIGMLSQAIGVMKTGAASANNSVNVLAKMIGGLTSPVGIAIAATAALSVAVVAMNKSINKEVYEQKELTKELQKQKEAMEEVKKQRQENLNSSLSEIDYVQKLRNELSNLVDENGKVKEGYKGRVQLILGELNKALGTEYSLTGDIINQYDSLRQSIDETIEKKKASIILSSKEEAYTEAIKNQKEAVEQLNEKQKDLNSNKSKLNELNEQIAEKQKNMNLEGLRSLIDERTSLKALVDEKQKSYDAQRDIVYSYYDDINDYEKTAELVHEGTAESIKQVNDSIVYSYQGRKDDTIASLNEAISAEGASLQTAKELYERYGQETSLEQQRQAQASLESLAQELVTRTSTVEELGVEEVAAWKNLATTSYGEYSAAIAPLDEETQKKIQEATGVIAAGTPQMQAKAQTLGEKTVNEFDRNADAKGKALNTMTGYLNGLDDDTKKQLLKEAGIEDVDIVLDELNRGDLSEENGRNLLKGLWNGLKDGSWQGKILSAASGLAQAVNQSFTGKSGWDEHSPSKKMKKFAEYYIQPIHDTLRGQRRSVMREAQTLASGMNRAFNSKITMGSLNDFNKVQGSLNNKIIDSQKTIFTTPQIVFNVQELDEAKLQQCFNYVNKKFGSAY